MFCVMFYVGCSSFLIKMFQVMPCWSIEWGEEARARARAKARANVVIGSPASD